LNPQLKEYDMPPNILAIDDDPLMLRLITAFLQPQGYHVDVASGAMEALHMLAEKPPDLVCCDLMMPVMSGLDFLHHIRQIPEWANLPVIVVSAAGEDDVLQLALALGASGRLPKPFTRCQLLNAIESALDTSDQSETPQETTL
jgi:CheY-like chemotaxis protein